MGGINGGVTDMHTSQKPDCDGEMVHVHNDGRYEVWKCNCDIGCGREDRMLRDKYQEW